MTPTPHPQHDEINEEIDLAEIIDKSKRLLLVAWKHRRYSLQSLAVTLSLGLVFAFGSTQEYTASTKILPYRSSSTTNSGLSGLAGLAGIRLPANSNDPTITADLYPEVAKTLDFRIAVAETPIHFTNINQPTSPATYFLKLNSPSVVDYIRRYSIGLPRLLISAVGRNRTAIRPPTYSGTEPQIASYNEEYLTAVDQLKRRLSVDINRKTAIITIQATMPDRYAAAGLVRAASDRLMERIIDYESRKAGEQRKFIEEEQRRAQERFDRAQIALAAFTDRNRGTLAATAQIEAQRLQNQYNLAFDLYRQFSTELEQSRIRQNQDTPVFTVLEQVVVPNVRSSPRRMFDMMLALALGLFAGFAITWWKIGRRTGSP